jgi:Flp pilus assembly protein TadG
MHEGRNGLRGLYPEDGSFTIITAVALGAILGLLALVFDLGQWFVVRNELQNLADAAALAGAKKLIQAKDKDNPQAAAVYCEEAIAAAQAVAAQNRSSGLAVSVSGGDIVLGKWNLRTASFERTGCSTNPLEVNAVQVTVRRDGSDNPQLSTFFAGFFGIPRMSNRATAVAYLGVAGTSSLDLPFAVPTNYPAGQGPYSRGPGLLNWLAPSPAYAASTQVYIWKDLGGATLDTTRATFIMPTYEERTSLSHLQKYLLGPKQGGLHYPQLKVGQKVYPISEYRWAGNVFDNFRLLSKRFEQEKREGKWRVTVAVYGPDPLMAARPPFSFWQWATRLWGPTPALACVSYTVPQVYVQGLITVDLLEVICSDTCKSYSYPDERSCFNTCYLKMEVPLTQNFLASDTSSSPTPFPRDYRDMNPSAQPVGTFAAVPKLVK